MNDQEVLRAAVKIIKERHSKEFILGAVVVYGWLEALADEIEKQQEEEKE